MPCRNKEAMPTFHMTMRDSSQLAMHLVNLDNYGSAPLVRVSYATRIKFAAIDHQAKALDSGATCPYYRVKLQVAPRTYVNRVVKCMAALGMPLLSFHSPAPLANRPMGAYKLIPIGGPVRVRRFKSHIHCKCSFNFSTSSAWMYTNNDLLFSNIKAWQTKTENNSHGITKAPIWHHLRVKFLHRQRRLAWTFLPSHKSWKPLTEFDNLDSIHAPCLSVILSNITMGKPTKLWSDI